MNQPTTSQPASISRLAPASGSRFFAVRCPKCGWRGMSNETEGGNPIADTGDFTEIVCPVCYKRNEWVPVDDAPNDEAHLRVGERKP